MQLIKLSIKYHLKKNRQRFYDENAVVIYDPDYSEDEDIFLLLGMSNSLKFLVVCHCLRDNDDAIRIISARKADKKESFSYGG